MAAIQALKDALGTLVSDPVVFVGGLAYAVIVFPQSFLQLIGVTLVGQVLQVLTFFITPLVLAGTIGMALEGLTDDASLGTLLDRGREHYVSVLVGNVVRTVIVFTFVLLFGIAVFVAALVVGIGAVAGAGSGVGPQAFGIGTVLALGAIVLLVVVPFLIVMVFIQFYPVAIVVDDRGAVDGIRRSVGVVRRNLLATLGYSIISVLVGFLAAAPVTGYTLFRLSDQFRQFQEMGPDGMQPGAAPTFSLSPLEAAPIALVSLVITVVVYTFHQAYGVAFWRRHS